MDFAGGGQITNVGYGNLLSLSGNSRVASGTTSTATSTNSALTGLNTIGGELDIANGASVTTAGNLSVPGLLNVDNNYGQGGSTLNVGGVLTISNSGNNQSSVSIGNGALSAATTVSAARVINNGSLYVTGSGANQATLNVAAAAGFGTLGKVTGSVILNNDSLIDFQGGGSITAISYGNLLSLTGNARVASGTGSAATSTNSALTGLTTVGGELDVQSGASVSTGGNLVNTGLVNVDTNYNIGGSTFSVAGRFTNNNTLSVGNVVLSAATTATLAGGISNNGTLNVAGSSSNLATLNLGGAAGFGPTGGVQGTVNVYGNAVIHFDSGQITNIGRGNSLSLNGDSRIASGADTSSNSALTGLTTVGGTLSLDNGASVTTGNLSTPGTLNVATGFGTSGAVLDVNGVLTNSNTVNLGTGALSADAFLSADRLINNNTVNVYGNSHIGHLAIAGTTTGSGVINVGNGGAAEFGASVSAGQLVDFTQSSGDLILDDVTHFAATIRDFSAGDMIDVSQWAGATTSYAANAGNTGGTLTVTSGAQHASLLLQGQYSNSSFHTASDTHSGTLITYG